MILHDLHIRLLVAFVIEDQNWVQQTATNCGIIRSCNNNWSTLNIQTPRNGFGIPTWILINSNLHERIWLNSNLPQCEFGFGENVQEENHRFHDISSLLLHLQNQHLRREQTSPEPFTPRNVLRREGRASFVLPSLVLKMSHPRGTSNYQLTLCFVWMKTSRKTDSGIINPSFSLTEHAYCEQWFYNVCACCGWKHPWRLIWEFLSLRSLSVKEGQLSAIESFIVAVALVRVFQRRSARVAGELRQRFFCSLFNGVDHGASWPVAFVGDLASPLRIGLLLARSRTPRLCEGAVRFPCILL